MKHLINEYTWKLKLLQENLKDATDTMIKHFKDGIGGYYITDSSNSQEYDYHIYSHDDKIHVKIFEYEVVIFDGNLFDFQEFYKKYLLSEK